MSNTYTLRVGKLLRPFSRSIAKVDSEILGSAPSGRAIKTQGVSWLLMHKTTENYLDEGDLVSARVFLASSTPGNCCPELTALVKESRASDSSPILYAAIPK
jgi:hypothetical protein